MAKDVLGMVYLLHFSAAIGGHARHYVGWTSDLTARLEVHRAGNGARLTRAAARLQIAMEVVASWPGTRSLEAKIKRQGNHCRHCPICRQQALFRHRQIEQRRRNKLQRR